MSSSRTASQEYLKNAVMTAGPEQLHLMLLDGAIRFTHRAIDAVQARQIEGAYTAFERAQRIVLELSNGLRREMNPQLVDQMAALYNFIYRRLVDASMNRDPVAAGEALRILQHQRETWIMLIDKLNEAKAGDTPAANPASGPGAERVSLSIEG